MKLKIILCLLAGAANVASFEPFAYYGVSFASLAVLFYCWLFADARQSFVCGLTYGLGLFLVGVSWVYISLNQYGGMPFWMGSIAVFLFALLLSLFIALSGYFAAKLVPMHSKCAYSGRLFAMPCLWVLFEWLKGWVFTGFPWLEIGLSQTPSVLFAFAPIGGVYLVSFVVVLAATAIVGVFVRYCRLYALVVCMLLASSTWYVNELDWSKPVGNELLVTVVQGNIPINSKWQSQSRNQIINQYARLTGEASREKTPDLIVWPETALPLFLSQTSAEFFQGLKPKGSALLTGILESQMPNKDYNAAVLVCDDKVQHYRKRHLVPFGEYLPLRFLFNWVLDYLQLPMSDFSAWQGEQPLNCSSNINVALSICYEDAFASESRQFLGDATILINISEDAWFGDSFAPHQRVQIAQMRARELARPLIRSANSGPSVFIDAQGKVIDATSQFESATLTSFVQPNASSTLFLRYGNWIIWTSAFMLLVLVVKMRRTRKNIF